MLARVLGLRVRGRLLSVWLGLLVGWLRGRVPHRLLPGFIALRTRIAWRNPKVREDARREMRLMLEHTRPDADLEVVARRYVHRQVVRGELRWHPRLLREVRMEGLEHLQEAVDQGRGVVFNWMHHGQLDATSWLMAQRGLLVNIVGAPKLFGDVPAWLEQHNKLAVAGGHTMVSASEGAEAFVKLLKDGQVLSIAVDVPGRTPVHFLGRDLVGSFGAPRMAMATGALVVLMTAELDHPDALLATHRVHPALDPADFADAGELHRRMLELHEPYLVRFPELYDIPSSHWGVPGDVAR